VLLGVHVRFTGTSRRRVVYYIRSVPMENICSTHNKSNAKKKKNKKNKKKKKKKKKKRRRRSKNGQFLIKQLLVLTYKATFLVLMIFLPSSTSKL